MNKTKLSERGAFEQEWQRIVIDEANTPEKHKAFVCFSLGAAYQRQSGVDWKAFSERLMDFITNAQVSSGVCCCGDSMQGHADPMASGHSPVDVWDNAVFEIGREFARLNGAGSHE